MDENASGSSDAGIIATEPGTRAHRGSRRTGSAIAATSRAARLVLLTALIHLGLAAQDPRRIALQGARTGVEPEHASALVARGQDPHAIRPATHPGRATATLTGVVRDSASLGRIAFAEVRVSLPGAADSPVSGYSDRFGAFVIPTVPSGPLHIEASAFGYAEWARDYDELPDGPVEILLAPAPFLLDSLGVEATNRTGDPVSFSRDAFVVDPAMIRAMPAVLERDVLRALAISPSASAPSDYVSVPYVRGGTGDGTPIMLDGVRLFNPFHLGGFLSAVNAEAVDHVALLPSSGAGAQHIGSLSGAIEIATRDGARDRRRVAGAVGLASTRLTVEGPLGEKASYLFDGRRSYVDILSKGLEWVRIIEDDFPYSFADLHAKVTGDLGVFRRLSVTGYVSTEGIAYERKVDYDPFAGMVSSRERYDWGNAAVAAHYRDRLAGALLDVTIGHSRFGNDQLYVENLHLGLVDTAVFGTGHMTEDRVDLGATWHLSLGRLTAGAQAIRFAGDHDYLRTDFEEILPPLVLRDRQWRYGAFANLDAPLGRTWRTRAGLRLDRFDGVANTLAPFAEVSYAGEWWEARISAARSYQSLASLRIEEAVSASFLAYDLVVPVKRGPVPHNTEITAGWVGSRGDWRLRLDGYARKMDNLRLPAVPVDPLDALPLGDPSFHFLGSGTVAGVEASWSWADGPLSTLGSYRWGRSWRTVREETYVPRFHREHELELGAALERQRSTWSARFSLRSGQPTTPALGVIPLGSHAGGSDETRWVVLLGDHNTGRLPHYLRLDLGWRRKHERSSAGKRIVTPFVSVTNLFSAPNVVAEDFIVDVDDEGRAVQVESHYVPQMPMLAFFGVEFRF